MEIWDFIQKKLEENSKVMLLYVLESEGSSPGRKGFRMAVTSNGDFIGSIGGGIMEYKSVEKARSMLVQDNAMPLLMRQYHDKDHSSHQSGMICSGNQLNAFICLSPARDKKAVDYIIEYLKTGEQSTLQISQFGLELVEYDAYGFKYESPAEWSYTEFLHQRSVINIIGGGHIGLALSELMHFLGFYIKLYDDRPDLNTIAANMFADEKHLVKYETIGEIFPQASRDFTVIMTIGYRTDLVVLKQLLHKDFFYLGLLGSHHKIETLFSELEKEGIPGDALKKVHSPVGIPIHSKTTREIAVSIAAEIIKLKNER